MNINPPQVELDRENYRLAHGSGSLQPYLEWATSRLVMVKHADIEQVVVVDVDTHAERIICPAELKAGFGIWLPDEMVFYSGDQEAIASATRLLDSINVAEKYCLYGKAGMPAVVNS